MNHKPQKIGRYALCLCAFVALFSPIYSQELLSTKSKKAIELYISADNFRVRGQLDQAIDLLNQAIAKDSKFEEAYYRLGLTYRSAGNLAKAAENFEKGLSLTQDPRKQKTYAFILGESYLRQGKYDPSLLNLDKFLSQEKTDKPKIEQAKVWKSQCEFSIQHKNEKLPYQIKQLSDTVNAYPMQYFPTITADEKELIFTIRFGKAHDDNEDIVVARKEINGQWGKPISLSDQINSNFREGASTISADGRKLIFTICGPRGCDLFESLKVGGNWSKPINLGAGVNSAGWEAQPSLSADGNELYFVSDRKGGAGGYDIWYSKKMEDGAWGKAINLGKTINTPFDEIAPFIHVNNQNLYFASNGLPGFGSYDIFVSEKTSDRFPSPSGEGGRRPDEVSKASDRFPSPLEKARPDIPSGVSANGRTDEAWTTPTNMGAPLNDFEDQYSFTVTSDGQSAYYSKEEGRNKSKIYFTPIPKQFQVTRKGNVVKGLVTDAKTKMPLKAEIELKELKTEQIISKTVSDSITGEYLIVVPGKSEYALYANKKGYLFSSLNFNYQENDLDVPWVLNIELQPIGKDASVVLNNIFFEFDKFELQEKSKAELNEVILFLKNNPSIKIEIGGHTDNSGMEPYNQQLSLKRAISVGSFLKNNGILTDRVKEKGYGSQKPLKINDSEENRRFNRRIEFKILL
jgi:OmpA-OmpF porin, OOP family